MKKFKHVYGNVHSSSEGKDIFNQWIEQYKRRKGGGGGGLTKNVIFQA